MLWFTKKGCACIVETDERQYVLGDVLLQEQEVKGNGTNDEAKKKWVIIG